MDAGSPRIHSTSHKHSFNQPQAFIQPATSIHSQTNHKHSFNQPQAFIRHTQLRKIIQEESHTLAEKKMQEELHALAEK